MDLLCTDKTGTLTEDNITLIKYVDIGGKPVEDIFAYSYISSYFRSGFHNPLDTAVKNFKLLVITEYQKVDEVPFDFTRKRDTVVVRKGQEQFLISKGAPEEMRKVCAHYGTGESFTLDIERAYLDRYHMLSAEGFRVLSVAIKKVPPEQAVFSVGDEQAMTFLGFIAFLDPAKQSVTETLQRLEEHGVTIKIITGDNELVTQKIARDIKLPMRGTLMGHELDELTDAQLAQRVETTTIFARILPEQKKRIIE